MTNDYLFKTVLVSIWIVLFLTMRPHDRQHRQYLLGVLILPLEIGISLLFAAKAEKPAVFLDGIQLFFETGIYYSLMVFIHRYLKKRIRPSHLSYLWIIPNILYFFPLLEQKITRPLIMVKLPLHYTGIILKTWLCATIVFLAATVINHFQYRYSLLHNAHPIIDKEILALWRTIQEQYGDQSFPLVSSGSVKTPVSIGILPSKIAVVLSQRHFSKKEYELIFRHELTHIYCSDAGKKCMLLICAAVNWFNPLMIIALKKIANDIECSCDEAVTCEMDIEAKKEYAFLLLQTASVSRGFTTNLSSSDKNLKERISSIFSASEKKDGYIYIVSFLIATVFLHGLIQIMIPC